VAVIALETLVFSMIPIRGLPGARLIGWSKLVWSGFFFAAAFGFVHVVLHPSSQYNGSTTTVLALFAAFGTFSVAFWAYFRFRKDKEATATPRQTASANGFSLAEYDAMRAREVMAQLPVLTVIDLRTAREHEREGKARRHVLDAIGAELRARNRGAKV
jgi:hypothetical protein